LGLPGETYKSWIDGLGSLLNSNIDNHIFVYQAEVYPNTELNEESYKKKYGIKTKRIELLETHCSPKDQKWLKEYQEIVIETSSMTTEDWKKSNLFSVVLLAVHSFKLGFYIMNYLANELKISGKDLIKFICDNANEKTHPFIYTNIIVKTNRWINNILNGKGRGILNEKYSDVYLDIEEIIFLEISQNYELFYKELKNLVKNLVGKKKWEKNKEIIDEVFAYQDLRMPRINMDNKSVNFRYNIAEYLFYVNSNTKNIKIKKYDNTIKTINTKKYGNNYWEFTKKKIIWARKSDKIKNEIDYDNKILKEMKEIQKDKIYKENFEKEFKINMFDKINKFKKYDSLEIKKNRRLHNS